MNFSYKKILGGLTVATLSLCMANTVSAREFKMGLITPGSHVWTQMAEKFGDDFSAKTDNEHSVAVFPAGQLGNESQMIQQLQTGALDMAFLTVAEVSNRYKDMGALYAPYLVTSVDEVGDILDSDPAQEMLADLQANVGVVGIGYGTGGLRQIVSAKEVNKVEDLKGKKIRVTPQEPLKDLYLSIGTAPTPLPLPDVYDALNNGQIDATDMDLELIIGAKFYDKAETVVLANHMMWPVVGVVSNKTWQTLSDNEKDLVKELMRNRLSETVDIYVAKEAEWKDNLLKTDTQVLEVGPEFFGSTLDDWEDKWNKKSKYLVKLREVAAK